MKKLICYIFGHKYYVIKKYGNETRKLGCRRCPGEWGMNDRVKAVIPWDDDLQELHEGKFARKYDH